MLQPRLYKGPSTAIRFESITTGITKQPITVLRPIIAERQGLLSVIPLRGGLNSAAARLALARRSFLFSFADAQPGAGNAQKNKNARCRPGIC